MAEVILFNSSTKHQLVCSTFARHTKLTLQSQPCKRAANVSIFSNPADTAFFNIKTELQQQKVCASHKPPCPPTTLQFISIVKFIIFALSIFLTTTTYGQSISGKIIDKQSTPLEFVTISIKKDTATLKTYLSDKVGNFKFDNLAVNNKYILSFSLIGFEKLDTSLIIRGNETLNITLLTQITKLKTVTVISKRPTIERKADRLIFNVENSLAAQGGTAWDAIKSTPLVYTTELGSITSQGKSLGVLIDDKLVQFSGEQLLSYLSTLKSDDIKRIEVINNPPAKYEAEGLGGLLNIVLKKDKRDGFNGSLRTSYQQNSYAKLGLGTSLNYRKKKLNLFANYNLGDGNYFIEEKMWQKYSVGSNNTYFDAIQNRKRHQNSNSIRTGIDYQIDKKNIIGVLFNGTYGKRTPNDIAVTNISKDKINIDSTYITNNSNHNKNSNSGININFKHTIDSLNSSLNFDVDYLDYNTTDNLFNTTSYYNKYNQVLHTPTLFKNNTTQVIKISSFKIDYQKNTKKGSVLEIGSKFSNSKTDNDLLYYNWNNSSNTYIYDQSRSNHFLYNENIFALYASYGGTSKKLEYKFGLRSEYTDTKGQLINSNQITNRNYFEVFPTAYLQYSFNDNYSLGIDYSRRLQRPAFWELNPFRLYFTPNSYSEGNPFLQPAFTHEININSVVKGKHNLSAYFGYTKDYFTQISEQDNINNIIKYTRANLAKQYYYGFTYNASFTLTKWWTFTNNIDIGNEIQKTAILNSTLDYNIIALNTYLVNAFTLSKNKQLTGEITVNYLSPRLDGIKKISSTTLVAAGIKKKAFNNNVDFTLYMFDIFRTSIAKSNIDFADQRSYSQQYYDTQGIRFTAAWKFGKNSVQKNRDRKTSNLEETNRVGN